MLILEIRSISEFDITPVSNPMGSTQWYKDTRWIVAGFAIVCLSMWLYRNNRFPFSRSPFLSSDSEYFDHPPIPTRSPFGYHSVSHQPSSQASSRPVLDIEDPNALAPYLERISILIDSRDRNMDTFPDPNAYEINLSTPLRNVVRAKLVGAEIPPVFSLLTSRRKPPRWWFGGLEKCASSRFPMVRIRQPAW